VAILRNVHRGNDWKPEAIVGELRQAVASR
jgi:hypothetical protein